ncbi:hypothetical protein PF66_06310 [Pseudomonas asplenii]|uniref:Uncharacterized protein n=1 Tax=Pseudomonas asplenii TaxID=53407 RepID=A0A0M9GBU2_9PSED|nr:hypothetical protein [Pseudomonas fuscovaginae]KPA87177.1 hypothetical protein PF66_06310 [Pseudomonas fuscovaginae]
MDDDPIPLDHLYAAMEAHIAEAIPALAYVGTMPDKLNLVPLPGVVIELTEWEPGHDPGTGEVGLDVRFEARVIVAGEEENALRMAAFAAAQITILLRMQTWGLAVEPAKFVRAAQDWSRPELDGYAVWMVEWTQIVYLGQEEWPWPIEPGGKPMVPGDDGEPVELEDPV